MGKKEEEEEEEETKLMFETNEKFTWHKGFLQKSKLPSVSFPFRFLFLLFLLLSLIPFLKTFSYKILLLPFLLLSLLYPPVTLSLPVRSFFIIYAFHILPSFSSFIFVYKAVKCARCRRTRDPHTWVKGREKEREKEEEEEAALVPFG